MKLSSIEKMLFLSIAFNMVLLFTRFFYTREFAYSFYIWNTFLAVLPLVFSRKLASYGKPGLKAYIVIAGWLLFFPNAPYILTDIFHYTPMPPVPYWFDLLLVTSAAWNGLLLGIVSLMQVEQFLALHFKERWVKMAVFFSMVLCGYGVYIGRFLRFNSWDIVSDPLMLFKTSAHHVLQPLQNVKLWSFTFLFATMYCIIYFTLKQLRFKPGKAN